MKHANAFVKLVNDALQNVPEIGCDEVMRCMQGPAGPQRERFILIDVREDREWAAGHIAGAIHVGKGVIERDIEARVPDHGEKIVLYCGGGYRSVLAAEALMKMGYDNVYSMAGGWREWCELGLPAEK